jgi:2-iminobutanoate/2-iminopropanoate deaminase
MVSYREMSELLNTREPNNRRIRMKKEAVKTGPAPLGLPFSPALRFGELLFVSGQGPIDKNGKVIPGDIKAQTKATLENFKRILDAAGSDMSCVLQTTVYLRVLLEYSGMNETYSSFFTDPKPARTTVQAGDLLFGMKVEVQGIAYVPDRRKH